MRRLSRPEVAAASQVTTVALLTMKNGLSSDLFSAYWRDVHGILAARIPGFEAYTQFHLGRALHRWLKVPKGVSVAVPPGTRIHGIAEVVLNSEEDRAGLASSAAAAHIQEDEQYVFRASLLYNLVAGASRTHVCRQPAEPDALVGTADNATVFLLLGRRKGCTPDEFAGSLEAGLVPALAEEAGVRKLRTHTLASGDPSLWCTAGVDNGQTPATAFDMVLQLTGEPGGRVVELINRGLGRLSPSQFDTLGKVHAYEVRGRYQMVRGGRPTHLGLRGFSVLNTIAAAGAENQRSAAVLEAIYGIAPASPALSHNDVEIRPTP